MLVLKMKVENFYWSGQNLSDTINIETVVYKGSKVTKYVSERLEASYLSPANTYILNRKNCELVEVMTIFQCDTKTSHT